MFNSLRDLESELRGVETRMPGHEGKSCRQLEIEILNFVREQRIPVSLEKIESEINRNHDPPMPFYEFFHHAYNLVDGNDMKVTTEGNRPKIVFTASR
jgi:hypothetical protein